jgi:hypothetical protein
MIFTKVLDISDPISGIARMSLEKSDGERITAALSLDQVIYFRARLEAICAKLKANEEPMS